MHNSLVMTPKITNFTKFNEFRVEMLLIKLRELKDKNPLHPWIFYEIYIFFKELKPS